MSIYKSKALLLGGSYDWATMARTSLHNGKIELLNWNQSGSGWIEFYKTHKPQLIMIDYLLSRRDAFECLKRFSALQTRPYIIFSHSFDGLAANAFERKALVLGANAVLQKPCPPEKLDLLLERYELFDKAAKREKKGP